MLLRARRKLGKILKKSWKTVRKNFRSIVACLVFAAVGFVGGVDYKTEEPSVLFTQQAVGGSFFPLDETGSYELRLVGVKPHTLVSVDGSDRTVGSWTNADFIARWDQSVESLQQDPPHAVLITHSAVDGKEYAVTVELRNPQFNAIAGTLTYNATLVSADKDNPLTPSNDRHMEEFPQLLRSPALFIED